ncbi:CoA ester lyase [Georhizobium profundi]|uniref:CoA ester lyase n=1 Tax=Georhizobium profundi TaxID=2341112 RepID=A0A3S9B084_9HYPH|nr:CoA ester lyase [Georhizobium profundi]AZN70358.1 CoA ester lyase [Georhizobium profundi]
MSNRSASEQQPSRPVRPRRSVLYVPALNERAIAKLPTLDFDVVIFDLEDSIAPDQKDAARENMRQVLRDLDLQGRERIVRINGLDTQWGTEDLLAARAGDVDAILLPKIEEPAAIQAAASALDQTDAPETMRLWAMIETPKGIMNAGHVAAAARTYGSRLDCFVVGPNDIAKDTGVRVTQGRPYLVPWLMQILLAARAFGLDVIDGVYNDFRDTAGFADECHQGRDMGFDGKTLIHPAQIAAANDAFGIGVDERQHAERIVMAFDQPANAAKGVINIDGRMVERLHLTDARRLLTKADAIDARKGART